MTNIDFVRGQLPVEELLAQLAEEAAELAQAALKLRRVLDGSNPTPVELSTAVDGFQEEIADVLLCLQVVEPLGSDASRDAKIDYKLGRWAARLLTEREAGYVDVSG